MSDSVAKLQLRAFVERILRMKEEAKAINDDIREIYAEAKGNGFDKTVLGKLVSYVEKRAKSADTLAEQDALFDLYLAAYDGRENDADERPSRTHAHVHAREDEPEHDADGVIIEANEAPERVVVAPADPLRSGAAVGNEAVAPAPGAPTPAKKRWTFNDPAHRDCLDPAQCGGFSNLKLCERCRLAAADVHLEAAE